MLWVVPDPVETTVTRLLETLRRCVKWVASDARATARPPAGPPSMFTLCGDGKVAVTGRLAFRTLTGMPVVGALIVAFTLFALGLIPTVGVPLIVAVTFGALVT